MDLVLSPKCTFLRPKCEKNKSKHRENNDHLYYMFFIQMLHIYSGILRKYTYKYKYYNVQLVLNIN